VKAPAALDNIVNDQMLRERATTAREFDPAEIKHGVHGMTTPPVGLAVLPLVVVVGVNLLMSLVVLPRLDVSYLSEGCNVALRGGRRMGPSSRRWPWRIDRTGHQPRTSPALRETMDAGANASVLPALSVASLGAVVAAMPAFAVVRDAVLEIGGGPLVSLAVATNTLAALTGSSAARCSNDEKAVRAVRELDLARSAMYDVKSATNAALAVFIGQTSSVVNVSFLRRVGAGRTDDRARRARRDLP
jgi:hypothetical protein